MFIGPNTGQRRRINTSATRKPETGSSWVRGLVAAAIGLIGCVAIWIAAPLNNFFIVSTRISDDYLPIAALFILLVLAFVINPLLGLCRSAWKLTSRQLIVIMGMVLVASVLPGQGLLQGLPYGLAGSSIKASAEPRTAQFYKDAKLPPSLFPDKLGYEEKVTASDSLLYGLLPSEHTPWNAWIGPLVSWAPLFLFYALMMTALARIVVPQWRDNEHLAFPLLEIYRPLAEAPAGKHLFGGLFRKRRFWAAAGLVFFLYLLSGANLYYPSSVPAIPLKWNLSRCFTEGPLQNLPGYYSSSRIYFTFVGIAFMLTARISFSIWFTMVGYGIYQVIHMSYFPPYRWETMGDQRAGVVVVLVAVILWLGRARWAEVARSLFRPAPTPAERQNRTIGWMFLIGMAGMAAWFVWAGAKPLWAFVFVCSGFTACLLIARVVAETGLPFLRIFDWDPLSIMDVCSVPFVGAATMFIGRIAGLLFHFGTRISAAVMATHVFALEDRAESKRPRRFGPLLVTTFIIGVPVLGAVLIYSAYRFESSLSGGARPTAEAFTTFDWMPAAAEKWQQQGVSSSPLYNRTGHIILGIMYATVTLWLCMRFPAWPLHPVGFLVIWTYYGEVIWASVFIGWLARALVVRYGGARLYNDAKPVCLGLIFGELMATVFWSVLPAVVALLGHPYVNVPIRP